MFDRPFGPLLTGTYEETTTSYHEIDPPGGESSNLDCQILSIVTLRITTFPRKPTGLAGFFFTMNEDVDVFPISKMCFFQ